LINDKKDGSGKRLYVIRKALNLNQADFAKLLNCSNGHMSDMENDKKNITDSTIQLLMLKCDVNENYLRYGIGEMFLKTSSNIMEQLKKEFRLDDFDYNLVYNYLTLSEEKRKVFRDFFYNVIEPTKIEVPEKESILKTIESPSNPVEKPISNESLTEAEIEDLVEDYRRQLETEKKQKEKLLVLQDESLKEDKKINDL